MGNIYSHIKKLTALAMLLAFLFSPNLVKGWGYAPTNLKAVVNHFTGDVVLTWNLIPSVSYDHTIIRKRWKYHRYFASTSSPLFFL